MKVLQLSANFYPEKTGIGVIATDCALFISQLGHDVTVLTGMPYYPEWTIRQRYRGRMFMTEHSHDITVRRVWLYVPKVLSPMTRIAHEISFSALASLRALVQRFDLLLCISPPFTAAFAAALVASLRRKTLCLYLHDIQPDTAVALGMLASTGLIRFLSWVERRVYARSTKILVLSEAMARNLEAKGVSREKLVVVPPAVDVAEPGEKKRGGNTFRELHGLHSKFLVMYSGNLGVKQSPTMIVECAKRLVDHADIFFAVSGEGAMKEAVQKRIGELGLTNIRLFPLCERDELPGRLSSADLLLAPQRREVVDVLVPSKVLTYFASGRPVLASAHPDSELARLITDNDAGMVVPPGDVDAMAEAILFLRAHPLTAHEMGGRGYNVVSSRHAHHIVREKYYRPLFGHEGILSTACTSP